MKDYDALGLILLALEKLSSYVVRFLLWAGVVGNTIPAASPRTTLPHTELSAVLYGEPEMPLEDDNGLFERMGNIIKFGQPQEEADEALKWLAELERKNNMPEKNDNDFIKKILEYEKRAGHEIKVEFNAEPHIARWAGAADWSIISGSTSDEGLHVDFGNVPNFKYEKASYEETHDLSQYKCDHCGRGPVQLWREGRKDYAPPPRVLCLWCMGDVVGYDYRGRMENEEITVNSSFHEWVPAIPYNNQGEYLVMPIRSKDTAWYGVDWWLGLKR